MVRNQSLAREIAVVDGISSSGKSLIAPLLSTLERGELWLMDHIFEYLCVFDRFGKIERSAATALSRLYADLDLYNLRISRNVNLRQFDISGAYTNLLGSRQENRLRLKDGDGVVSSIQKEKPFLVLMVHYIFHASDLLFDAFQNRLKLYVLTVRHPLWLVEAWHAGGWASRFDRDPRDFQLCCEEAGRGIPWFARDWAFKYRRLKSVDQTIHTVEYFVEAFERRRESLSKEDKRKVFFVPFEPFVKSPSNYMGELARRLGTRCTPLTGKMLKKLNLPRTLEKDFLKAQRSKLETLLIKEKASAGSRRILDRLCEKYEKRYGLGGGA